MSAGWIFSKQHLRKGTVNHLPWMPPGVRTAVRRGQVCGNQSSGVYGSAGRPGHHDPHFSVPGVRPHRHCRRLPGVLLQLSLGVDNAGDACTSCCSGRRRTRNHYFFFNWSIVDLQRFVSFWCTAKWLSYTHTHTHIYIYIFFFNILFHYGLSQEIGYSSLCSTVGPCCLSIFCM